MKIEYTIYEHDFLSFNLFFASKSKYVNAKKRSRWIAWSLLFFLLAIYYSFRQNLVLTLYFAIVGAITALLYPKYFDWYNKKHFKSFNREHFSKRFGQQESLEITENYMLSKDESGEGKVKLSEVEGVYETEKHFFVKISTGLYYIIPKIELANSSHLREKLIELGIPVWDETNWKWT